MPKGTGQKTDFTKTSENPPQKVVSTDTLSPIDKGHDFVKAGETAHISNR